VGDISKDFRARVFTSTDVCETFISVRGVALKIPDECCRGKTRFPKRNEMLVHVDPLCINKIPGSWISRACLRRRFRQFRRTGTFNAAPSSRATPASRIGVKKWKRKSSDRSANRDSTEGWNCEARFINGCSGSDLALTRHYRHRKSHHVCGRLHGVRIRIKMPHFA
jgi:hypothetical protein